MTARDVVFEMGLREPSVVRGGLCRLEPPRVLIVSDTPAIAAERLPDSIDGFPVVIVATSDFRR